MRVIHVKQILIRLHGATKLAIVNATVAIQEKIRDLAKSVLLEPRKLTFQIMRVPAAPLERILQSSLL